jgi:hypothetical protein
VILLHLNLPNTYVQQPLRELAQELNLPLLDVRERFERKVEEHSAGVKEAAPLAPAGCCTEEHREETSLVFRAVPSEPLAEGERVYWMEFYPQLTGSAQPVNMYDDGTNGDERAGDGVWSLELAGTPPGPINYAFLTAKESTAESGITIDYARKAFTHFYAVSPDDRHPGSRWFSPLHPLPADPFSSLMVAGDPVHPNPAGHLLIAGELAPLVESVSAGLPDADEKDAG